MSYYYIDYLDYTTSGKYSADLRALRLRFDLLVFANDTLLLSVPACVKLKETTMLLSELDPFWISGRIKLQLDKKHKLNPMNYFRNRSHKLEVSMDEHKLLNHFEYTAYSNQRTADFFTIYLPQVISIPSSDLYIDKVNDTDALFREATKKEINNSFDSFASALRSSDNIKLTSILYELEAMTGSNSLFQRAIIEERLKERFTIDSLQFGVVSTILDRSFAFANAETSLAQPITSITSRLTGIYLARIMASCYPQLYRKIKCLSFEQVFQLSNDHDLRKLVDVLNALVFLSSSNKLVQIGLIDKYGFISLSLSAKNLASVLFDISLDLVISRYFENELVSALMSNVLVAQIIQQYNIAPTNTFVEVLKLADRYFHRVSENVDSYPMLSTIQSMSKYQEIFGK